MTSCSTHVLDAALGRPAAGVACRLLAADGTTETAVTDADGRARFAHQLGPGDHQLVYATGHWFAAAGRDAFFAKVTLDFTVAKEPHYHVALLLSPYSYTTYRGS